MKNFLWGVLLFVLNIFLLYQNYTKNFSIPTVFFIEANQMMAFLIGIVYAQQCRKFNIQHILGLVLNSAIFAILTTILFAIYEAPVTVSFTLLLFGGIFLCMFISYAMFYWLFCPAKYKHKRKRKKYEKSMAKKSIH